MSWPNGGTPPPASGVKLLGTKPSLNDAAPLTTPICEATGTVRMYGAPAFFRPRQREAERDVRRKHWSS
jgi:hypothetical protein